MRATKDEEKQAAELVGLTGKQAQVLASLVGGSTIDGAAKQHTTNPATVHAWFKKEEFRAAYRAALAEVIDHSSGQLKAACGAAVATLREVAEDSEAPAAPRVSAARAILELSMKQIELDDFAQRLEALESLTP